MAASSNGDCMHQERVENVNDEVLKEVKLPAQAQQQKVEELRAAVGPVEGKARIFTSDACLRRYLRARNWNVRKAEKMLRDTLSWRTRFRPEEIRWDDVAREAETGKIYRTNFHDKLGRSVLVLGAGRQNTSNHEGQMKHLVYCLENAIITSRPGTEKIVWLIDFRGWTLAKSPSMKAAAETLHILQSHYPERLGAAICYNPPHVFQSFWKMVKPFIDPVTYQKIKFVYSDRPETLQILEETFDLDLLEKSFGGRLSWEFNFESYSGMMREDDVKTENQWRIPPEA